MEDPYRTNWISEMEKLTREMEEKIPVWKKMFAMSPSETYCQCAWEEFKGRCNGTPVSHLSYESMRKRYTDLERRRIRDDVEQEEMLANWKKSILSISYSFNTLEGRMNQIRDERWKKSKSEKKQKEERSDVLKYEGRSLDDLGEDVIAEILKHVPYDDGNWASICLVSKRWNRQLKRSIDPDMLMYGYPIINLIIEGRMIESFKSILDCPSFSKPPIGMFEKITEENWMEGFFVATKHHRCVDSSNTSQIGIYLFHSLSRGDQNFDLVLMFFQQKEVPTQRN
eukprot:TRINITY_DN3197_c0_g1_i2.p1 TRINITY_DN3197_c0_g1~~TRINITY_DN3197_c0_g1_i2.p1  ORF type:complete len:283 (+),score=87.36 TRINITY_DN3197_c0_g1_i2:640-1488(+)